MLKRIKRAAKRVYRSAVTGRWVSRDYAERNPSTTVSEEKKKR